MAVQTAVKFLELLDHHGPTRTQYSVANPQSAEDIVRWAVGKGFIFTVEDLVEALAAHKDNRMENTMRKDMG